MAGNQSRKSGPSKEEVNLQVDVGVIKSQVADLKKSNERIETKLDNLNTVPLEDFKKFVAYVEETFVKKESLKGAKAVGLAVLTALAISATLGIARLLGTKF